MQGGVKSCCGQSSLFWSIVGARYDNFIHRGWFDPRSARRRRRSVSG